MEHVQSSQHRNSRGYLVVRGGLDGHGGDTKMHPSQLFYCGQNQQECRCNGCDGVCGPTNGCPCNSCVELVNFKVNKLQHLCRKGTVANESVIGQENIKVTDLYYCGRTKNQCYCGLCDGVCGPNGCPCFDCLELVGLKVNRLGHFSKRGFVGIVAIHLGKPSSELFYCGRVKETLVCKICVGVCDPTNGCPCVDCFKLSEFKINRVGDVCHKGNSMINGGHTGTPCKDLFYCNKAKMQCHCGNCNGNCGPTNGCPCFDCLELVGMLVLPARFTMRICKRLPTCPCQICRNYTRQVRNSHGNIAVKGDMGGYGGHTNIDSGKLYYCGIVHNDCLCGSCDGRCGPTNGCPCSSCIKLFLDEMPPSWKKPTSILPADNSSGSSSSSARSTEENKCVICLDNDKTTLLVPCGHYAFCKLCANGIVECAICRARIEKRVKVFES
ncbi:hypothetical protein HA402_005081 [Bradysia odoriphaga]|nr:hypothetical protein HA402_005081 [Bradysia odoriphaga]